MAFSVSFRFCGIACSQFSALLFDVVVVEFVLLLQIAEEKFVALVISGASFLIGLLACPLMVVSISEWLMVLWFCATLFAFVEPPSQRTFCIWN